MNPLPYLTADLPGIGGRIRQTPADFVVEELSLYEPAGEGEHVYVRITRDGMATRDIVERLCRAFSLREIDVGYAGLKDKQARVTQTFSLRLPAEDPERVGERIAQALPATVEWARRHRNKLKKGHLRGNRFRIRITAPVEAALERASAIAAALARSGLANFYGEQRFGGDGDNAARGREAVLGRGPRQHWLRMLLLSAWQSARFNDWLAERVREGRFPFLEAGDIARKADSGGLFEVEDLAAEQVRHERGEIDCTGPIFGAKMRRPVKVPGERERALLEQEGVTQEDLARARLDGTRRAARVAPADLAVAKAADGLELSFTLPAGSYATILLREFMKGEEG